MSDDQLIDLAREHVRNEFGCPIDYGTARRCVFALVAEVARLRADVERLAGENEGYRYELSVYIDREADVAARLAGGGGGT